MYNYKIMIDKQPSLDTSLIHRRGGRLLKLILMAVSGGVCAQTSAAGAFLCTIIDALTRLNGNPVNVYIEIPAEIVWRRGGHL